VLAAGTRDGAVAATAGEVAAALDGGADVALCTSRELVTSLSPVVRQRVARVLLQRARKLGRTPTAADIDDLHHDVFVLLFDRGARVLRAWDPARGLSLGIVLLGIRCRAGTLAPGRRRCRSSCSRATSVTTTRSRRP
jgi:hypothetical protein